LSVSMTNMNVIVPRILQDNTEHENQ
jgi:hypothetical protein